MAEYGYIENTTLTAIGDAIRSKIGGSTRYRPSEMAAAIEAIPEPTGMDPSVRKYIDGTLTEYVDTTNTSLPAGSFSGSGGELFSALTRADLHQVVSIGSNCFRATTLSVLILRANSVCTIQSDTFGSSQMEYGSLYVYVPAALVDSYKSKLHWDKYADRIRAIEDYPAICGEV